ncbi:ABC transporter permease, partial [Thioclava sp. BHET1]
MTGLRKGRRAFLGLLGLVAFVALWKAAVTLDWAPPGTLPDPALIPGAFLSELKSGRLLPAVGQSLIHYVWGLGMGSLLGFAVGFAAATNAIFEGLQGWLARILRPIPPLAWVVFAIAWFKVSHAGAAFVIAIGVFWVNYFATYAAVKNVDPRFRELARSFGQEAYLKLHRS